MHATTGPLARSKPSLLRPAPRRSDAEQRGVVIEDASAQELLPDLPYWQQGQEGAAQDGQQQAAPGGPPGQQQQQQELLPPPQQQQAAQAAGLPAPALAPQQGLPAAQILLGSGAGQAPAQGAAPSGLHPLQRRQLEQQQQQQQQPISMPMHPQPLQPPQQQAPPGLGPPPMQAPQQWRPPQQQPRPPGAYPSLPTRR